MVTTDPFEWGGLGRYKQSGRLPDSYPEILGTFWSGQDRVHELIVDLLKYASNSIVLNVYGYDLEDADAVIRAKMLDPHVYVQMSLDSSQAGGVHERDILAKWPVGSVGTSIAIGQSVHHAISHLKVCVIDGLYVMTGSTNWSLSGTDKQDNQLLLVRDAVVAHEYRTTMDINHSVMLAQMVAKGQAGRLLTKP